MTQLKKCSIRSCGAVLGDNIHRLTLICENGCCKKQYKICKNCHNFYISIGLLKEKYSADSVFDMNDLADEMLKALDPKLFERVKWKRALLVKQEYSTTDGGHLK